MKGLGFAWRAVENHAEGWPGRAYWRLQDALGHSAWIEFAAAICLFYVALAAYAALAARPQRRRDESEGEGGGGRKLD